MPVIKNSSYRAPFFLREGNLSTIFPNYFRKVRDINYARERIDTPDVDFIDLDWSITDSNSLVIILHGLEGNSKRDHILGMVKAFNRRHWDAVVYNFRGCSGEMNRLPKFYHAGATEDLQTVLEHVVKTRNYQTICIVGFSLGGNLTIKYIGERKSGLFPQIKAGVGVSVPCDLKSALEKMGKGIYAHYFLSKLIRAC